MLLLLPLPLLLLGQAGAAEMSRRLYLWESLEWCFRASVTISRGFRTFVEVILLSKQLEGVKFIYWVRLGTLDISLKWAGWCCVQVRFLSTWPELRSSGKRECRLKIYTHHIDIMCGIFLISDWYWRTQVTVGSATVRQVVLGYIKEQIEQVMENPPWSLLQ